MVHLLPSSCLTAAMAATHGVYNNEKTKKTNAVNELNKFPIVSVEPPKSTVRVLTTLSFAVKPVIKAVETLQSPNPSGLKIGAITPPKIANKLSDEFATGLSLKSKLCKNHIIIEAINIIVNALVTKSLALSPISFKTLFKLGIR